jgi:hypothetical protein
MTPELIIGVVIAALLVYAIATHKIDLSKLKGDITSHLAAVHATAQATHAAALAPVSVVNVSQPVPPSDPAAIVARAVGAPAPQDVAAMRDVVSAPAPIAVPAVPNRFAAYAGWPMVAVLSALQRRLTPEEEAQALAAGVQPLRPGDVITVAGDLAPNGASNRDEEENATSWDVSRPNSPRIFRLGPSGGVVSRSLSLPPSFPCAAVILHSGDTQGNAVDVVDLKVTDANTGEVCIVGRFPVRYSNHRLAVQPGHSYVVTMATDPSMAIAGSTSCALAAAVEFEPVA